MQSLTIKYHQILAEYFETRWRKPYFRAIDELPFHYIKGKQWDLFYNLFIDFDFLITRCYTNKVKSSYSSTLYVYRVKYGDKSIIENLRCEECGRSFSNPFPTDIRKGYIYCSSCKNTIHVLAVQDLNSPIEDSFKLNCIPCSKELHISKELFRDNIRTIYVQCPDCKNFSKLKHPDYENNYYYKGSYKLLEDFDQYYEEFKTELPLDEKTEAVKYILNLIRSEYSNWIDNPKQLFQQLFHFFWWSPLSLRPKLRKHADYYLSNYSKKNPLILQINKPVFESSQIFALIDKKIKSRLLLDSKKNLLITICNDNKLLLVNYKTGIEKELMVIETIVTLFADKDKENIIIVTKNGNIIIYDLQKNLNLRRINIARENINTADFTDDGKLLIITKEQGIVELWETTNWTLITKILCRRIPIDYTSFSGDEKYFATINCRGLCVIYSLPHLMVINSFSVGNHSFILKPAKNDSAWWFTKKDNVLLKVGLNKFEIISEFKLVDVAISEIAIMDEILLIGSTNGYVNFISKNNLDNQSVKYKLTNSVSIITFSEDEKILATVDNEGNCFIHELSSINKKEHVDIPFSKSYIHYIYGTENIITGLDDGNIQILKTPDLNLLKKINCKEKISEFSSYSQLTSNWVTVFDSSSLLGINIEKETIEGTRNLNTSIIKDLKISSDGTLVVTCFDDGFLYVLDFYSGAILCRHYLDSSLPKSVLFGPDASCLFVADNKGYLNKFDFEFYDPSLLDDKSQIFAGNKRIMKLNLISKYRKYIGNEINCFDIDPVFKHILVISPDTINILDNNIHNINSVDFINNEISICKFSPCRTKFITVSRKKKCILWDTEKLIILSKFNLPLEAKNITWRSDGVEFAISLKNDSFVILSIMCLEISIPYSAILITDVFIVVCPYCGNKMTIENNLNENITCIKCENRFKLGLNIIKHNLTI